MKICTFASGSKGNCTLVSVGGYNFLIDAGISMRRIVSNLALCSLQPTDISAIFITHQHSDHISGLAMLLKHYPVPVYAPASTARHLRMSVCCPEELICVMDKGGCVSFGEVRVCSFATCHDTEDSVGYRFEGDKVFAIATDTGMVSDEVFCGLCGADLALIESNHDIDMLRFGAYPYYLKQRILSPRGHLSNDDCARLAYRLAETGTKYMILGHLSRENNTPGKAFAAVSSSLEGMGVAVYVAPESERLSIELGGDKL